ncbi:MAG: trans-sulfuration enzyme family protein [Caulobacterales bacterium]|uniref:trans-sulfuration enzyme family protein n=1 Tax=Glycocaulis sp. TaxID=1969725 RepID=UPI003FA08C05
MSRESKGEGLATRAARAGINADPGHGGIVAPINVSATYVRERADAPGPFDYARTHNPGRAVLAEAIAGLEGANAACLTASGMAAIDLVLNLLPSGARIVAAHDCYGGTQRLFNARAGQRGFVLQYADATDLAGLEQALKPGADLLFLETPSNPRLRITDIEAASALGHGVGAKVAVDNTVLSPAIQRPLELGADIVISSLTKIINGHSDMVGGVVCTAGAGLAEDLAWWLNASGTGLAAFDAFLATRGLRTLPLRARAQSEAALELATRLSRHGGVARVDYPGLKDHPGHELASRQQGGLFGPLLSLEVKGDPGGFLEGLQLFTLAQSLGGAESLVSVPALMTHAAMSADARAHAGISDNLIRLSVGLEDVDDLWRDLETALARL